MSRRIVSIFIFFLCNSSAFAVTETKSRFGLKFMGVHRKLALFLEPSKAARSEAANKGIDSSRVVTLQPNVVPTHAIAVSFDDLNYSYAGNGEASSSSIDKRGRTRVSQHHLNYVKDHLGVSAAYVDYKGLYRYDLSRSTSKGMFKDSMFASNRSFDKLPSAHVQYTEASLQSVWSPESVPLRALMQQTEYIQHSGFSLTGRFTSGLLDLNADEALIPENLEELFAEDATIQSFRVRSYSLLPGAAAVLASNGWFSALFFYWGLSYQLQETNSGKSAHTGLLANAGDVSGVVGYSNGDVSFGLNGRKSISTSYANKLVMTSQLSHIEVFCGLKF